MESSATSMEATRHSTGRGNGLAPEHEQDFQAFEGALDDFSQKTCSDSWFRGFMLLSQPSTPWTVEQSILFQQALERAPAALKVAPYATVSNLVRMHELAAEQSKLPDCFWSPLRDACDLLYIKQK